MFSRFKQLDSLILLLVLAFMGVSTMVIYGATVGTSLSGIYRNNLIYYAVLGVVMIGLAFLDYRAWLGKFAWYGYGFSLLLLVYVKFKGLNINGSTRWINLHVIQFQPSELTKLFLIVLLASFLLKRGGEPLRFWRDVVPMIGVTLVPFYFVLEQPDMGTSIVLLSILIGMLWIGNIRKTHLLIGILLIAGVVTGLFELYRFDFPLFIHLVKPHQLARIQTFLGVNTNTSNDWQAHNSLLAIGTGGLTGTGFLRGTFINQGYIPFDYADSIFVVIGEEFGFIGSAALLLLYFLLFYRMVSIGSRADRSGGLLIVGIISMLVLQIFENIAMGIGLMPLTGIPLPFISYGGSSLLTNMLSMALVLSIHLHPQSAGDVTEPSWLPTRASGSFLHD